jgi:hypothetical protein
MAADNLKNYSSRAALLVLFLLAGCFSNRTMMTYKTYDEVQMGTSLADVESQVGQPYSIHHKESGDEYEYVERINVGNSRFVENRYFLIIQNGKVVGKYMNRERPPAYDLIYQEEPNYPGYNP